MYHSCVIRATLDSLERRSALQVSQRYLHGNFKGRTLANLTVGVGLNIFGYSR